MQNNNSSAGTNDQPCTKVEVAVGGSLNITPQMEEFGRRCFYEGREIERFTTEGEQGAIFKHSTYNGYLRMLNVQR
jgi:hypothetical protein